MSLGKIEYVKGFTIKETHLIFITFKNYIHKTSHDIRMGLVVNRVS